MVDDTVMTPLSFVKCFDKTVVQLKTKVQQQFPGNIRFCFNPAWPETSELPPISIPSRLATDDREVAVKVQYPGVAAAVRADLQNLGMILRVVKRIAPGLDPKTIGDEIRHRIEEELDYELEAQNQRTLARIFKDHPFIVVPGVVTALSRERVRRRCRCGLPRI